MATTPHSNNTADAEEAPGTATRRRALRTGVVVAAAPAIAPVASLGAVSVMQAVVPSVASVSNQVASVRPAVAFGDLSSLQAALRARIIWQDQAIAAVADALRRAKEGLAQRRGPLASFLFLGPQGVGKTMLAQGLAEHVFASKEALTRIDLRDSVHRPLQRLIEAVRARPAQVVLLDAIDHASAEVREHVRAGLEHGTISAGGLEADFRQAILILATTGSAAMVHPDLAKQVDEQVRFADLDREALRRALEARG